MKLIELLQLAPVIPVLKIENPDFAIPVAEALVKGGLPVLEVTLRTESAIESIKAMSSVTGARIGVGTVTQPQQFELVKSAGAEFVVTPGLTSKLAEAGRNADIPLLPGVMTPSELMFASELGFNVLKLFPAEVAGGIPMLKSLGGPFAKARFCPTGGVSADTMGDYLKLPNVVCVGGSWLVPDEVIEKQEWSKISDLAAQSVEIAKQAGWTN